MTKRQAIKYHGGGFMRALLDAVEKPCDFAALREAWFRADNANQARLERVFPGLGEWAVTSYNQWPAPNSAGVAMAFPEMSAEALDAEVE